MIKLLAFITGLAAMFGIGTATLQTKQTGTEPLVGVAPRVFTSAQVGDSPVVGYYLKTDGVNSTWAAVTGGGGGSDVNFTYDTANNVVYSDGASTTPTTTIRSFAFFATSTTATSTFPNLSATNTNLLGKLYANGDPGIAGYYLKSTGTGVQWAALASGGGTIGTSSIPTIGDVTYWTSASTVASVATGTLTESITGLQLSATRALLGGAADLSLTAGYEIPLSASTSNWNTFYNTPSNRITAGNNLSWNGNTLNSLTFVSTSTAGSAGQAAYWTGASTLAPVATGTLTTTATGLQFDNTRGLFGGGAILSLTTGYEIPLSASTTQWARAYASTTALSGTSPIQYAPLTGAISILQSGTAQNGYLSSTDWNIFNQKVSSTSIDTSSELAALLTDETGSGNIVFSASPIFTGGAQFSGISASASSSLAYASATSLTVSSNLWGTNATITNSTSTSLFATNLWSTTASSSSLYGAGLANCTGKLLWANGQFSCGTDATGNGIATTTDNNNEVGEIVSYITTDFYVGGNASNTTTFNFDHDGAKLTISSSTVSATGTIYSQASAIRIGSSTGENIDFNLKDSNTLKLTSSTGVNLFDLTSLGLHASASSTLEYLSSVFSTSTNATSSTLFSTGAYFTNATATGAIASPIFCLNGDCRSSWPTSGAGGGSISTSSIPTAGKLAYWTSASALSDVATGTLTESVTGLNFSATNGLVGGAAILQVDAGYSLASTSDFQRIDRAVASTTALSATTPLQYAPLTGAFTILQATGAQNGYLSSTDWSTFNQKVSSTSIDTSSELAALLTDETGTGNAVFSISPTFTGRATFQDFTTTSSTLGYASSSALTIAGNAYLNTYTATAGTTTSATSTNLSVSGTLKLFGGAATSSATGLCILLTGSYDLCDGSDSGGAGGSPAGSNTYAQYNNSGAFGSMESAVSGLRWVSGDNQVLVGTTSNSAARLEIDAQDAAFGDDMIRVISRSASGANADLHISSPDADIEFCNETMGAQPNDCFELDVPAGNNQFYITPRNAANTSYENPALTVHRDSVTGQGLIGINTRYNTPQAMLEVVGSSTVTNIFDITSIPGATNGDYMEVDMRGFVGIGSSTPASMFSIASSTYNYSVPMMMVATSSVPSGMLFTLYGTTTGAVNATGTSAITNGVRARFGPLPSAMANTGDLSQLFVNGMIDSSFFHMQCVASQIMVAPAADANSACGDAGYQEDASTATGGIFVDSIDGNAYTYISFSDTAANTGAGLFFSSGINGNQTLRASTTVAFEAMARMNASAATTSIPYMGFASMTPAGTTYEVPPLSGAYFTASSTQATWVFAIKSPGGGYTTFDTGIASTSYLIGRILIDGKNIYGYAASTTSKMRMVGSGSNTLTAFSAGSYWSRVLGGTAGIYTFFLIYEELWQQKPYMYYNY